MVSFMCESCGTVGIVSPTSDGGFIVSPCDCVMERLG